MASEPKQRLRYARRPVILTANKGGFLCRSDDAVDLAFMLSRAEGFLAQHRNVDRMQLGELLVSYIDGELTPEEVRREIGDWTAEIATAATPDARPGEAEGGRDV